MAKSYPHQLGKWVKQRVSTRRDKNLVGFLAVMDDVKIAVDAGYPVKTVWTNMRETGRIDFGYGTFLNHVNRLLRGPNVDGSGKAVTSKPKARKGERTGKGKPSFIPPHDATKPAPVNGFTFDPAAKKEDLI